MSKRIGVFFDVPNQFNALQGSKLNFRLYLEEAIGQGELFKAFAYGAQIDKEAQPFIHMLKKSGYEPKYQTALQGNIAATDLLPQMLIDILRLVPRIDEVVIGSNDQRLVSVLSYLKDNCIDTLIFAANISQELRNSATRFIEIQEYLLEKKNGASNSA